MSEAQGAPRITVSLKHTQVTLEGEIRLTVRYTNVSPSTLHRREPAKCWETRLVVQDSHHRSLEVRLGRLTRVNTGQVSRVIVEDAQEIELAPGGSFEFEVDAGAGWPELFRLGRATVQIIDEMYNPPVASSTASIQVVYGTTTPEALLAVLRSDIRSAEARHHAAVWLDALHGPPLLPAERAGTPHALGAASDKFEAWWKQHQDSSDVKNRIEELNLEAKAEAAKVSKK